MGIFISNGTAQPNVFNHNDPIVTYSSANPPVTPPADVMAKWVRTSRMTWNTSKFKCYYWNGMAFRLRFPNGYDPADLTKKYPVIVFFHGAGEIAPVTDNELQLIWAAQRFEASMDAGQFNGFMLFPQVRSTGWDPSYFSRVNSVLDSLQKYCRLDQDRVIAMGLSNGGYGALSYTSMFPRIAATAIGSSPAAIQYLIGSQEVYKHIPLWISSGGKDPNPDTSNVRNFVDSFTVKGGHVRYSYFPTLGHHTWTEQWNEPYLVPYWQAAHKANPMVFHRRNQFSSSAEINARIGVTGGFYTYQWQKDGVDIPGAVSNEIIATQLGAYRVHFKRTASSAWSDWSPIPAVLSLSTDNTPPSVPGNLSALYTGRTFVHLDWGNSTDATGIAEYDIYINGVKKYTSIESGFTADNLLPNTTYTITVKARDLVGNNSAASNTVTITTQNLSSGIFYRYYQGTWNALPNFNKLTPVTSGSSSNVDINVRPSGVFDNFAFVWEGYINITTPGTYTFETVSDDGSKFYFNTFYSPYATALVNSDGLHGAIAVSGTVNIPTAGLYPIAVTYFEKSAGETMQVYYTGPGITRRLIPNSAFNSPTPLDTIPPTAPANVKSLYSGRNFATLDWDSATDNVGVAGYDIYVGGVKKYTTTSTSITADSLAANTSYVFTVKARDLSGNTSPFSNSVAVTTAATQNGLNYRYYEGEWNVLPDFNALTPVKVGSTPNIDLNQRKAGVNDNFAFVWEGYINIKVPGNYTFETISDDGSKFYFNSFYSPAATALVNNDGLHGAVSASGTRNIPAAGYYPVAISFFERGGGESMQLYWTGPAGSGITRQLVPASAFADDTPVPGDNVAPSVPANLKVIGANKGFIVLDWENSTDNIGVAAYDVFVGGIKKYTTTVSTITADSLEAGTAYTFTVKARDLSGNLSSASNAVSATTTSTANGLSYRYYEGNWNALPAFNTLTPLKTGLTPNIDLGARTPGVDDNFAFVWEGYIFIPAAGNYTFETVSDDGSKFYFNSFYSPTATALVNNDGLHGPFFSISATVNVPAPGMYPVAITYFEQGNGETMQLYYTGPGIARRLIPNSAFTNAAPPPSDNVAPGTPANLKVVSAARTFVHLDWSNSTDNVGVTAYDVFIGGIQKYTTTASAITADSLTPNTTYNFTVKARDLANNISAASNMVSATTTNAANGLNYRYYEGTWNALPNFNALTAVKTGLSSNIDLGVRTAGVDDNFGLVWEGYINITTPGTYTFETISDDGSKLYFNTVYSPSATALVDNDGLHGSRAASASVNVPVAGLYPITITFFEQGGGETMQVYWTGPGITRQLIPNSAFTNAAPPPADNIAPTAPANLRVSSTSPTFVHLDWNNSTDNVGVTAYDVFVGGVKKYTTTEPGITADNLLPNTSYTFTVKARDLAGNLSLASNAGTTTTTNVAGGLTYRYYEGNWSALPNFNTLTPVKTGTTPNIDLSVRTQGVDDNFGFVWEGYIYIPTAGNYTFETISDDGSKFYFNSFYSPSATALVNNDGLHGPFFSIFGTVSVPAPGYYPVAITFFEQGGGESMFLYYTGPGITRQLVPTSAFSGTAPAGTLINLDSSNVSTGNISRSPGQTLQTDTQIGKAYPNPFKENLFIDFNNSASGNIIHVEVYDFSGKFIHNCRVGNMPKGNTTLNLNLASKNLMAGIYYVRLSINGIPSKMMKVVKSSR